MAGQPSLISLQTLQLPNFTIDLLGGRGKGPKTLGTLWIGGDGAIMEAMVTAADGSAVEVAAGWVAGMGRLTCLARGWVLVSTVFFFSSS